MQEVVTNVGTITYNGGHVQAQNYNTLSANVDLATMFRELTEANIMLKKSEQTQLELKLKVIDLEKKGIFEESRNNISEKTNSTTKKEDMIMLEAKSNYQKA